MKSSKIFSIWPTAPTRPGRERFVRFQHDWAEDYARVNGLKKSDVILALSTVFNDQFAKTSDQQIKDLPQLAAR